MLVCSPTPHLCAPGLHAIAAAALSLLAGGAGAQTDTGMPRLRLSAELLPAPKAGQALAQSGLVLQARRLHGRPDVELQAEGDIELRRAGLVLKADALHYDQAADRATASGQVSVERDGSFYAGPRLELTLHSFEGFFLQPQYRFARTGAGGSAQRIDFIDASRSVATQATYTSCHLDGKGAPDWLLSTERVRLDFENNEGIAQGAVLRFKGVPILALPTMSFPVTEARKSGWLPPSVNLDNRSGFELAVPYYWNIAPNRDATLTPRLVTRRGLGLQSEFRYLEPGYEGSAALDLLPNDAVAGRSRWGALWSHDSSLLPRTRLTASVERVSDDAWWKDFPRAHQAITARLLPTRLQLERGFDAAGQGWQAYVGLHHWQVLQALDGPIVAPYQRSPQLGLRGGQVMANGLQWNVETEVNRFTLGDGTGSSSRPTGWRWHGLASVQRSWGNDGWFVVPKLQLNAAQYSTDQPMADGRQRAARMIPSLSVDAGLVLERDLQWQGRALRQTLEPRLLYLNTPFRAQIGLPNFDAAGKDFNLASIYSDNAFTGIDRVSDAHQLTAGVTTRFLDAGSGAETLRLSLVQRMLLRDQRITPEGGTFSSRFSDLLLLGSTSLLPNLALDAAVQYSPDLGRPVRSIMGARYTPGPFRTLNASYRLARGASEQLDVGWQWPLQRGGAGSGCSGTLYGVGRINYSLRDSRITDSLAGLEYDSGCWIARVVAERVSTGRSEATTRLLLQLELVGLSRLGSNPLKVLKDNIPGYQLLREERSGPAPTFHP